MYNKAANITVENDEITVRVKLIVITRKEHYMIIIIMYAYIAQKEY